MSDGISSNNLSTTLQSLGSVLNTALTNIDQQIEIAKTEGKCSDSTVKLKANCKDSFCYDTEKQKTINGKTQNNCSGNNMVWKEREWNEIPNNDKINDLNNQRTTILNAIQDTLKTETKTLGQKNALLSQLQTAGDNIDENKKYIEKKISVVEKNKQNNKKLLKIANYEYERIYEFKTMLKTLVYGLLVILVVMYLIKKPWFPTTIGIIIISAVIAYLILTTLSRFFTNMRRNDRSYSVINQTSKNHKYNNVNMNDNTSAPQIKKPKTFGEMIFGTSSCDNFIGHKSIPYQTNFNNLKSFRT